MVLCCYSNGIEYIFKSLFVLLELFRIFERWQRIGKSLCVCVFMGAHAFTIYVNFICNLVQGWLCILINICTVLCTDKDSDIKGNDLLSS